MEEIGGLLADLIKSSMKADAARKRGEAAPSRMEVYKRFLVGTPDAQTAQPAAGARTIPVPAPSRAAAAPAPPPAPLPAVPPHQPVPLLADFRDPHRFLAAYVLVEALGPPVGLRRSEF